MHQPLRITVEIPLVELHVSRTEGFSKGSMQARDREENITVLYQPFLHLTGFPSSGPSSFFLTELH